MKAMIVLGLVCIGAFAQAGGSAEQGQEQRQRQSRPSYGQRESRDQGCDRRGYDRSRDVRYRSCEEAKFGTSFWWECRTLNGN